MKAGIIVLMLVGMLAAIPAGAQARGHGVRIRLLSHDQASILERGLRVRIRAHGHRGAGRAARPGQSGRRVRIRVRSRTFDNPVFTRLAVPKRVRVRGAAARTVHLRLGVAGRAAIASCEARALRAKAAGRRSPKRMLRRSSPGCLPQRVDLTRAQECDFIGQQSGSLCLLPFPDDYYTRPDPSSATGRRIALSTGAMPANVAGTHVDAGPYDRNDGFSPGQPIVLRVPGLDNPAALAATNPVGLNHLGRYSDPGAPVVVIDATTGKRWPIWVELDSHASTPERTALEINPAVNFVSGHRYVVALRDLKRADGSTIPAPEGFRYYRDDLPSSEGSIEAQRDRFENVFEGLRAAGIRRSNLYLAWDFTVASDENIASRMLHIRDDAFGRLGDTDLGDLTVEGAAPSFEVSDVIDTTPAEDPQVARRILGAFSVPCYLQPSCAPGGRFALGADGLPARNGDWTANFECIVPRVAVDGTPTAVRPAVYGHGLFGSADEVHAGIQKDLANDHGFILCATDEIGMSGSDLANTSGILGDLSQFPELADRLQQGLLDELFLGRLMIHPAGFASDPAFHVDEGDLGSPLVIDQRRLFYDGNSQGGIMGGALTAVAPDYERAVFGVPAMRYSILLPRSVDYDPFSAPLNAAYTDELSRPLLLSLVQMLWDRGEPNGYARRMTSDPLPNTPPHTVLMGVAFGDHQVTNWAADVEARTIGAAAHEPVLDPGRWPDTDVLWNVPRIGSYPYGGSAIFYSDIGPVRPDPSDPGETIGVGPPPLTNVPNRVGEDPHGAPRGIPAGLQEVSDFLRIDGAVTNVCGPFPCYAGGYSGP